MTAIAVTGLNSSDNPGPGLGIARSLKQADPALRVVGLGYDAMETGLYLEGTIDHAFVVPYPGAGAQALLDRLLYIKGRSGLDLVIPSLDIELPLYVALAPRLAEAGIACFLPDRDQFRLRGKDRLDEVARRIGIAAPRTLLATSLDELYTALDALPLPVMIKGAHYKALHAATLAQAVAHYHAIVAEWGHPVLVQQVVAGDEINLAGVGDGSGRSLGAVAVKKISTTVLGKIWTGVTVTHPDLLAAANRFVADYKWRGPFELECISDGHVIHLIEINPRFPAWIHLGAGVGVNLPARLMQAALGQTVDSAAEYRPGRLYVRYVGEAVLDMAMLSRMVTQGER